MNFLYYSLVFVFGVLAGIGLTWLLMHLECRPKCYNTTCRWNGSWLHTCATWDLKCPYNVETPKDWDLEQDWDLEHPYCSKPENKKENENAH